LQLELETLVRLLRRAAPERSALSETAGFALLGAGGFLLVAVLSFDPADGALPHAGAAAYRNLAGPVGARLAAAALGSVGLVALAWGGLLMLCGLLLATGFLGAPRPRRLAAALVLSVLAAAALHVAPAAPGPVPLPSGPGGSVGARLGGGLRASLGPAGAQIALALAALTSLALTRNLAASRTARLPSRLSGRLRRWREAARPEPWQEFVRLMEGAGAPAPERAAAEPREIEPPLPLDFSASAPRHARPGPELFEDGEPLAQGVEDQGALASELESQLREFKVEGKVADVTVGPVVTTVEFEPAPGTKVARIAGLAEDLARVLAAPSLRVVAPIPGRNTVGFEVPNLERRTIRFGPLHPVLRARGRSMALPLALGVDTLGEPAVEDLAEMPHLLLAGSTGSGKSVFIHALVASLVCRSSARELRLVLIDPKMIELSAYAGLPHLACPVVSDPARMGRPVLEALVREMEERYRRLGAVGARNLAAYNEIVRERGRGATAGEALEPMPRLVLLVDEFADLVLSLGREAELAITRLAQKARAAGIHLVIATQRPSVDVVTGLLKANFPTRIAFRVQSGVDSRTILDTTGAETLLGRGDLLYQSAAGLRRLHAPYLDDAEVRALVAACG
jgi:S-DNA-T family DNA segregation ATPase FtsK/SpoIIIE